MLATRSARLAALLLLALLCGWEVRACRLGSTTPLPLPAPTPAPATPTAAAANTFPDP
jgi:hypothetical protein